VHHSLATLLFTCSLNSIISDYPKRSSPPIITRVYYCHRISHNRLSQYHRAAVYTRQTASCLGWTSTHGIKLKATFLAGHWIDTLYALTLLIGFIAARAQADTSILITPLHSPTSSPPAANASIQHEVLTRSYRRNYGHGSCDPYRQGC
jgi:hypothetical protein